MGNFKQQLSKIEGIQKSQPIIKIGRPEIITHKKFPQIAKGTGDRFARVNIEFGDTFKNLPDKNKIDVVVGIASVDCQRGTDKILRLHVFAESISKTGFTLVVKAWHDADVFSADVFWIAVGKR